MIRDLFLAGTISTLLGVASLELWQHLRFPDALALAAMVTSIACGPYILWRRGRQPIIPIGAIYSVLLFFVILFVFFVIEFRAGRVDL